MRKTNWKIMPILLPFLLLFMLFNQGGVIDAAINGLLALIPLFIITRIFKIDLNVYYDKKGKKITKEEYEKLKDIVRIITSHPNSLLNLMV